MAESKINNINRKPEAIVINEYRTGTAYAITPRPYERVAIAIPRWGILNYSAYAPMAVAVPAGATSVTFTLFTSGSNEIIQNGAPIDITLVLT